MYRDEKSGEEVRPGEAARWVRRVVLAAVCVGAVMKKDVIVDEVGRRMREWDLGRVVGSLRGGRW